MTLPVLSRLGETVHGVAITPAAAAGARFGTWENRTTTGVRLHVVDTSNASLGGEATFTITGV